MYTCKCIVVDMGWVVLYLLWLIERNSNGIVVSASIECSVFRCSVFLFYLSLFLGPFPPYLPPPFSPSGDIVPSSVMDEDDELEDIESATDKSGEIAILKFLHIACRFTVYTWHCFFHVHVHLYFVFLRFYECAYNSIFQTVFELGYVASWPKDHRWRRCRRKASLKVYSYYFMFGKICHHLCSTCTM